MRKPIALFLVLLLCGCTSVSEIRSDAYKRYAVTAKVNNPLVSWRHIMQANLHRATQFCEQQGKQLHPINTATFGVGGWSEREAELSFECVPRWRGD
jgi:hypothetical protein